MTPFVKYAYAAAFALVLNMAGAAPLQDQGQHAAQPQVSNLSKPSKTLAAPTQAVPPPNFKMAFIGDQGLVSASRQVLELIKQEGAQAVLHLGDFDYEDKPLAWQAQIDRILGPDFPYFAVIGNHDLPRWPEYQQLIQQRFQRLGIRWDGDLGVQSSFSYKGIFFVLVGAGTTGSAEQYAPYLQRQLEVDHSLWSVAAWHKNQQMMQVGGKIDEAGWGVYEAARAGGAIIATGHEHSYSRTHLLSDMEKQTIVSTKGPLTLEKGKTFAFVSGLGGVEARIQRISGPHWAAISAFRCVPLDPVCKPGAVGGALFGTFNVDGQPNKARFYFKDIRGAIRDEFEVVSAVGP